MPDPEPWHERARRAFLRFWRTDNSRIAAVRDILVAAVVVLSLLGIIWAYTGQPFPSQAPLVVIESGSMMHGPRGPCLDGPIACSTFGSSSFGRIGTIDPGDLVLVKDVDSFDAVETAFGSGSRGGYGGHGDVLVYHRSTTAESTPVIHRAMLLILADPSGCRPGDATNGCTYRIPETCDAEAFSEYVQPRAGTSNWRAYCEGSRQPITLHLEREGLFLALQDYPCPSSGCPAFFSGFVTKGDNNFKLDQQTPYADRLRPGEITCCPVRMEQVIGKSRGEIPWFGLLKLSLYGNHDNYGASSDPNGDSQWTILRATAPWDTWVGLFAGVGLLVTVPIATDLVIDRVRRARLRAQEQEQSAPEEPVPEKPPRNPPGRLD